MCFYQLVSELVGCSVGPLATCKDPDKSLCFSFKTDVYVDKIGTNFNLSLLHKEWYAGTWINWCPIFYFFPRVVMVHTDDYQPKSSLATEPCHCSVLGVQQCGEGKWTNTPHHLCPAQGKKSDCFKQIHCK